ncbi:MAG: hypothetical protein AAF851_15950 [Myxococcota bacterium]
MRNQGPTCATRPLFARHRLPNAMRVPVLGLGLISLTLSACGDDDNDGNNGTGGGPGTVDMGTTTMPDMGGPEPDMGGGPTDPVISLTATTENISEAEGTSITFNFAVDGVIPAEGIPIRMEGNVPRITRAFTAGQVRVAENGDRTWRFDSSVADTATGGILVRDTALDADPASPGFLSNFDFTITEPAASVTYDVLDDIYEEPDQTFIYTLADGEGYSVDPAASSVSFTVTDGVQGGVGPEVSFTATPTELFEATQTRIELTFDVVGDIPAEGLVIELSSETPRAVAEFDVNAANPRLPEEMFTVDGPILDGATIVGTNEIASALVLRITQPTATMSVEVFDGDEVEGLETFTYRILDGEEYEVAATNNEETITINETPEMPIVGLTASTALVDESQGTSITFNFVTAGPIPAEGLLVRMVGSEPRITRAFTAGQVRVAANGDLTWRFDSGVADTTTGAVLVRDTALDADPTSPGFLSNFEFTITEPLATVTFDVLDDIYEEPDVTYAYTLADGPNYSADPSRSRVEFTVTDGVMGGVGPTIGVAATPLALVESAQTRIDITFNAVGEIPDGGLLVELSSETPRAVAEFDVNASNPRLPEGEFEVVGPVVTGGSIAGTNEIASALVLRITDSTATLSVEVFSGDEVEGLETFTYRLRDGEEYEVDPSNDEVTITIDE